MRGLDAISEAVVRGILEPDTWDFHFVGSGVPPVTLPHGVRPTVSENLPWPEYAALIRRVDVGLSLMSSPHPSYPPLDLAACGAVAVTNRFGPKQRPRRSTPRTSSVPDLDGRRDRDGLSPALALADDEQQRARNYERQQAARDWTSALEPLVDDITRGL